MSRLYVAGGSAAKQMTRQLLEAIQPEQNIDKTASIGLKPNLVVARNWKGGATTNPDICEAIIAYFQERGYSNIFVIESSWLAVDTKSAFAACGYTHLKKRYGIELIDVKKDAYVTCEYDGVKIDISKAALETDYLINLPLIKGHCQTKVTCALKNLKGIIPDREKQRFHALGLNKPIAYLNKMITPSLTIADGTCADLSFEEGGNPSYMNTMIAGEDSVLVDTYAAQMLGYAPRDIGYLRMAADIGVGSSDLDRADIVYINSAQQTAVQMHSSELEYAKAKIIEKDACSACYANLLSALIALGDGCDDIKICVGQGFKGKQGDIGCGDCTNAFDIMIEGCPPSVDDIKEKLIELRSNQ